MTPPTGTPPAPPTGTPPGQRGTQTGSANVGSAKARNLWVSADGEQGVASFGECFWIPTAIPLRLSQKASPKQIYKSRLGIRKNLEFNQKVIKPLKIQTPIAIQKRQLATHARSLCPGFRRPAPRPTAMPAWRDKNSRDHPLAGHQLARQIHFELLRKPRFVTVFALKPRLEPALSRLEMKSRLKPWLATVFTLVPGFLNGCEPDLGQTKPRPALGVDGAGLALRLFPELKMDGALTAVNLPFA